MILIGLEKKENLVVVDLGLDAFLSFSKSRKYASLYLRSFSSPKLSLDANSISVLFASSSLSKETI